MTKNKRKSISLRWHKHQIGHYQFNWYWGTRGNYSYGWKVNRTRICAGKLYITLWRKVSSDRYKPGWWR